MLAHIKNYQDAPVVAYEQNNVKADGFAVYTDNEVNLGYQVKTVLDEYRRDTSIDTRLFVCATQATGFSIADPNDRGMMDMAGFDSAVPGLMADFFKGNL